MTTSTSVGVASSTLLTTPSSTALVLPPQPPTVYIVGFAPSWTDTPWEQPNGIYWGMNSLHRVAGDRKWDAWFQLHDIEKAHPHDAAEHIAWLAAQPFPVFMWEEFIPKYPMITNAVPYPRQVIMDTFGDYFTNTVSWMVALAILQQFPRIAIYGIDMAQSVGDQPEYQWQRPSVEFFLGWARGAGIELEIPRTSDLLKTPFLYGLEDGSVMTAKYRARIRELTERRAEFERQRNQAHEAYLQISGALEDTNYWLKVWSQQESK